MSVLALGRQQALHYLISSDWLIGEAAQQGLGPSDQEVAQRLAERRSNSAVSGEAELHELTGQTTADVMFELKAELAAAKIHQMLIRAEPKISQAQLAKYYNQHKQRFTVGERREVYMTARKHVAEVDAIKREVSSGKFSASRFGLETMDRPHILSAAQRKANPGARIDELLKAARESAIFSAKVNVLTGPVKLRADYYLFEVKRILPAGYEPLAQAQAAISEQLAGEQRQRTLANFIQAWRTRWIARTDCQPGYVVPGCRQYKGSQAITAQP